ncbi:thioesterase family protein [Flavobacteriaceae bacterium S356]|uniref:Thioesterase family protein n=1 Tax=Asprobacillus argus TaxID=3076534 RepID=A0ABU3LEX6_9FLAO|nr:thioesterase family protein [Flavobacteriaceae bacterium S356]
MNPVFSKKHIVIASEIDELQHVNNVVYLSWIQDIANDHWTALKQGHDTDGYVWVVVRHEIDYMRQAVLGDVVDIRTWVGKTAGVKSVRHVEIFKEGRLLVKAQTTFCLLDAKTFRPTRITDTILAVLEPK